MEAIFRDPTIYALGATISDPPAEHGGRPRHYPHFMTFAWVALQAVYRSSRHVDAVLADADTWEWVRCLVREQFPDDSAMWLRPEPMRRHHFLHARRSIDPATSGAIFEEFERQAAALALELGLCDPMGTGSLTHPSLERTLYGDGKVVTPLYKAKPGQRKVDKTTGEVRELRADPDAKPHVTGGGEPAYGNKFVMLGVRSPYVHGRVAPASTTWKRQAARRPPPSTCSGGRCLGCREPRRSSTTVPCAGPISRRCCTSSASCPWYPSTRRRAVAGQASRVSNAPSGLAT